MARYGETLLKATYYQLQSNLFEEKKKKRPGCYIFIDWIIPVKENSELKPMGNKDGQLNAQAQLAMIIRL